MIKYLLGDLFFFISKIHISLVSFYHIRDFSEKTRAK